MEITGKIISIGETQSFGNNGFTKREFVIETEDLYPHKILLELIKDKCNLIDAYSEGMTVTASINLRGKEWVNDAGETKYFNSITAWKLS